MSVTAGSTAGDSGRAPAVVGWQLPLFLAIVTFVLAVSLSQLFPLLDPDEGRNAEIAREMLSSGGFIVPRLAGMPYLDKPPGFFWMAAFAVGLFGNVPWAARLPSAIAAALTIWVLCRSALRSVGPAFATRAGLLLLAAPLFIALSAFVIFDMALTLCVTAVWTGMLDEIEHGPTRRRRLIMFAAITAGILIKGPVMLAWVLCGSLIAALFLRSIRALKWLIWPLGWAMVLGVAGGWFYLAVRRHPEFPHYAFVEESMQRMFTGSFHREQPLWFVPAVLLGGAIPWSIATPWGKTSGKGSKIALAYLLFAIVFFTASRSKLVTYLLPAFPALAWIAAEAWSDPPRRQRGAWVLAVVLELLALGFGMAAKRLGQLDPALGQTLSSVAMPGAATLVLVGALVAVAAYNDRVAHAVLASLAFTPVVLVLGYPTIVQYAATQSGAALAQAIETAAPGGKVRYDFTYSPGTDFLLGRGSTIVSTSGEETTSNYQVRYRDQLIARRQWTPLLGVPEPDDAAIVVKRSRGGDTPPPAGVEIFRDKRFVAYRVGGALPATGGAEPPKRAAATSSSWVGAASPSRADTGISRSLPGTATSSSPPDTASGGSR